MVTWTSLATRVTASAAALLLTAGGLSACTPRPDGPEPAAQEFFDALTGGDTTAAAALTDRPEDARSAMNASWTGLQAERLDIATLGSKFTEDTGTVRYRFTWHLPKDRTWTYDGQLNMARDEGKWGVRWTSTDLHPRLGENQSLQLRADQPRRASVNELGGTDVLVPGYRYSYQLDARRAGRELMSTSRAVVDALRDLGGPTDPQLLAEQASSSTTPMELATLSKDGTDPSVVESTKTDLTAQGATDVGVLDSDEFGSLPAGNYVFYSGQYASKSEAQTALSSLSSSFPDAQVIEVAAEASTPAAAKSSGGGGDEEGEESIILDEGETKSTAPVQASKEALEELNSGTAEETQEALKKLPPTIETPGEAPPKDNKAPGGGSGNAVEIG